MALVSASAIAANARLAVEAVPSGRQVVADLRRDAWGHGARAIVAELLAAGVDDFLVDSVPPDIDGGGIDRLEAEHAHATGLDLLTLYGLPGSAAGAVPAMRLTGTVLSVKELRAGEGVSYGYSYRAADATRIALISGGYAQGIVRALGNRAAVRLAGARRPIVGRVAMDVCVVEIGPASVARGDEVVFFGDPSRAEPSLSEWTDATGMTPSELVTTVGLRSARVVAP